MKHIIYIFFLPVVTPTLPGSAFKRTMVPGSVRVLLGRRVGQ